MSAMTRAATLEITVADGPWKYSSSQYGGQDVSFHAWLTSGFPDINAALEKLGREGGLRVVTKESAALPPFSACIIPIPRSATVEDVCKLYTALELPRTVYSIIWHENATTDLVLRQNCEHMGVNAVIRNREGFEEIVRELQKCAPDDAGKNLNTFTCILCKMAGLSLKAFCHHYPLYHISVPNRTQQCPVCLETVPSLQVHVHEDHFHPLYGIPMEKSTGVFALACVYLGHGADRRWLLVQEYGSCGFWLPGGQLNEGETLIQGVQRECLEEAGAHITVTGFCEIIIRDTRRWRRVVFVATPVDQVSDTCKTLPDFESYGSCWATANEIRAEGIRYRARKEVQLILDIEENPELVRPLSELSQYFPEESLISDLGNDSM